MLLPVLVTPASMAFGGVEAFFIPVLLGGLTFSFPQIKLLIIYCNNEK